MKPRQTEYDAWMRFRKSIEPPSDDDGAFDRFVNGQLIVVHVDEDGNEICRAGHWIGAESVDSFDSLCEDIMGQIRDDECNECDYSDPDDPNSVFAARLDEIGESLATVLDELRNHRNQMDINWSAVAEANSLLAITDAVRQTATAFISNNT